MAIAKKIPSILFVATFLLLASSSVFLSQAAWSNDGIGTFSIAPNSGPPGTMVITEGDGFGPKNYIVDIYWDPAGANMLVGHTEVVDGSFSVSFAVPANATQGAHTVQANINDPPCTAGPDTGCVAGQIDTIHKSESYTVTVESVQSNAVPNASSSNAVIPNMLSESITSSNPSVPAAVSSTGVTSLPNTGLNPLPAFGALVLLFASAFVFIALRFASINH